LFSAARSPSISASFGDELVGVEQLADELDEELGGFHR